MKEKSSKGMGKIQANTKMENRKNILKVLMDEQPHKFQEISEKAKISKVTLWEHLKALKLLLEKTEDTTTYPHQILYKANPILITEFKRSLTVETAWEEIKENYLMKEKLTFRDLKTAIEDINVITNAFLEIILVDLLTSEDLRKNSEGIYLLLETFVWESYKELTLKLIEQLKNKVLFMES